MQTLLEHSLAGSFILYTHCTNCGAGSTVAAVRLHRSVNLLQLRAFPAVWIIASTVTAKGALQIRGCLVAVGGLPCRASTTGRCSCGPALMCHHCSRVAAIAAILLMRFTVGPLCPMACPRDGCICCTGALPCVARPSAPHVAVRLSAPSVACGRGVCSDNVA